MQNLDKNFLSSKTSYLINFYLDKSKTYPLVFFFKRNLGSWILMLKMMESHYEGAGVELNIEKLNSNYYYLVPKNSNFILEYIYYYLKFKESYIKELSTLTQQNNLIKSNLLNIHIPNISTILQNNIINTCTEFDNNINTLIINNKMIENKNIFDIITTINSYII